jgi:hypothetical protein
MAPPRLLGDHPISWWSLRGLLVVPLGFLRVLFETIGDLGPRFGFEPVLSVELRLRIGLIRF